MTNDPDGPHWAGDDGHAADSSREASSGTTGWQKALWIIGVLVLIALGVLLVTGDHGAARHAPDTVPQQDADLESPDGHDPSQFDH